MIIALGLLYFVNRIKSNTEYKIQAFVHAAVCWILYLYIVTEGLSALKMLDERHLLFIWGILDIALVIYCTVLVRKRNADLHEILQKIQKMLRVYGHPDAFTVSFLVLSVLMIILAMLTVPYNWDSMSYHLARIAHWKQNASVAHYVTGEIRQLTSPVLAEFVNLHVYILHGSNDSALNLLQAVSYIVNAVVIYGICAKIGIRQKMRYMGMLLYLSMPIAFAEALSTQVDEFATFWLLAYVYLLLDYTGGQRKAEWSADCMRQVVCMACCIAFGYLTKPSVLVGVLFFTMWMIGVMLRRKDNRKCMGIYAVCMIVTAGVLVLPEILRNLKTFHAVSAPIAGARQLAGTWNPLYLLINGMKNISLNLANIYLYHGDFLIGKIIFKLASIFHVEINDPSIAEDGREFFVTAAQNYAHDTAGNPVIVIGFLVLFLYFLIHQKEYKKNAREKGYILTAGLSFLFFCLIVRWEPYANRYIISYLALLCPVIMAIVQNIYEKSAVRGSVLCGLLVFVCLVDLYGLIYYHGNVCYEQESDSRRSDGYFVYKENSADEYTDLINTIDSLNIRELGVDIASDAYEYPIWAMLRDQKIRIESIAEPSNESAIYDDTSFIPQYIAMIEQGDERLTLSYHGAEYHLYRKVADDIWILSK